MRVARGQVRSVGNQKTELATQVNRLPRLSYR